MASLVAYTGGAPISHLLQPIAQPGSINVGQLQEMLAPTSPIRTKAAANNGRLETTK